MRVAIGLLTLATVGRFRGNVPSRKPRIKSYRHIRGELGMIEYSGLASRLPVLVEPQT
jgi:hypothetical protein